MYLFHMVIMKLYEKLYRKCLEQYLTQRARWVIKFIVYMHKYSLSMYAWVYTHTAYTCKHFWMVNLDQWNCFLKHFVLRIYFWQFWDLTVSASGSLPEMRLYLFLDMQEEGSRSWGLAS